MKSCTQCKMLYNETNPQYYRRIKNGLATPFICKECLRINKYMADPEADVIAEQRKNRQEFKKALKGTYIRDAEVSHMAIKKPSIPSLMRKFKLSHEEAAIVFNKI